MKIMKKLLMCLMVMCFSTHLFSLDYIESSNGLNIPQLEGGRTELEFADIDNDGNIDILSIGDHGSPYIGTSEHGIMVWFGDGDGNWNVYQNGNFGYGGIAVGDVNNDGLLDVGYAMHHPYSSSDFGDQYIEVVLGDGTGMNWTPWDDGLAPGTGWWGMFCTDFADIDNDGYLDIGSNSFGCCDGIHIYLNQADGSWVQSFGFSGGNSQEDFVFGDINTDGYVDFTVGHQYGTVYFGDGTGNFVLNDGNLPSAGNMGRNGTSLGDIDNDGGKDLSYINSNGGIEIWSWDETEGIWIDFSGTLPASGDYDVTQLYDMNADGYMDVIALGSGLLTIWLGDGNGNWIQDAQFNPTTLPHDCEALRVGGDIDHNGFPDIVFVTDEGSWPSSYNHLHCFKETSVAESLIINPMFPRGNEHFIRFSAQFVDWVSGVPDGELSYVKLEYSRFGNNGPWATISDSLPNNGRFQWTVPRISSLNCYIRYTAWTASDTVTAVTPSAFSISGEPVEVDNLNISNNKIFLQNYPNPFSQQTIIKFSIPQDCFVELKIYDIKGKLVLTLVNKSFKAGFHNILWNGRDSNNKIIPSGIYLYQINTEYYSITDKMLLLID